MSCKHGPLTTCCFCAQPDGQVPAVQECAGAGSGPPCGGVRQCDGPVLDGQQREPRLGASLEAAAHAAAARRRQPRPPHHALLQVRGEHTLGEPPRAGRHFESTRRLQRAVPAWQGARGAVHPKPCALLASGSQRYALGQVEGICMPQLCSRQTSASRRWTLRPCCCNTSGNKFTRSPA